MVAASVQEIVYAFLQTYYQRMKSNPSKLSNLYSSTAELTHINYTQITSSTIHQCTSNDNDNDSNDKNTSNNTNNIDMIPTIKLTGRDNISKFFTRHENKVNTLKIKLDTCDFQTMGAAHKNILIVVTGELFWDGTPAYQFCQTFVLIPIGKNSDIYDISNDIIRFIPDTFKEIQMINEDNPTDTDIVGEKPQPSQIDNIKENHESDSYVVKKEAIIVDKTEEKDVIHDKSSKPNITNRDSETNHQQQQQQKPEEKEPHNQKTPSSPSSSSSSSLHTDNQETISEQIIEPLQSNKHKDDTTPEPTKKELEKKKVSEKKSNTVKNEMESTITKYQAISLEKKELNTTEDVSNTTTPDTNKNESSINKKESSTLESLSSSTSSTTASQSQTPQPVKLSWASKLSSAEPTKESKKILVAKTTTATKIVIPETTSIQHQHHHNQHKNNSNNNNNSSSNSNSKKNASINDKKFEMGSRKDNSSNRRDRRKQQNSNGANKEGYYPVFVNGTYGIDDETLKNTLSKAFGTVVKINSGENFAVVDFQTYNSQVAALEMKKMMIQGFEISIERKTSKKGNLQHNSSNRTTSPDGFISSTKSHRKYQNNNNNNGKKRDLGNY